MDMRETVNNEEISRHFNNIFDKHQSKDNEQEEILENRKGYGYEVNC